ncbi:lytic transglycosylase domain-containing protein [Phaeodactylibacter sp.]|uniref:lytic transglycosylase domain-containing protein n=1 Tax=Phaeodactylibacter sp. TaxID=1940289 RepID=UPI0025CE4691|nr:lytic transglycosylase domain-containing protein [Phaeodactylibacter sp.]MCI4648711.1 transglycosylase SLT domain-containing protein [Phaeodactylibacter sp.]MCI5090261.1 transglycosylase SLT domain-containing protein [Phaeodactylibacter sp.]
MKTQCFKLSFGLLVSLVLACQPLYADSTPEFDEATIIDRLEQIEDPIFELKYNNIVGAYIRGYLYRREARKAELVTGRAVLYFPTIEALLAKYNMPQQLKYLPVVESALDPHAISPVGAEGLWQFMPGTAADYGLKVNDYVDERRDPHKSTEAAIHYLKKAYEKYGDWALALAAYNGGSGRVSRAIKRGRSKNFWKIRRYMPRETRNYVPAFIAATYLMEYYKSYDIQPVYPDLELQITEAIKVYDAISFYRIGQLTGLSIERIKTLNPAYKRDLIPNDPTGNFLVLPKRVMQAVKDYMEAKRPDHLADAFFDGSPVKALPPIPDQYHQTVYFVTQKESVTEIAERLKVSVHQLIAWNQLRTDTLSAGLELKVFYPKEIRRFKPMPRVPDLAQLPALPMPAALSLPDAYQPQLPAVPAYYVMRNRQRLLEFSNQFPAVPVHNIVEMNGATPDTKLRAGDVVKIPWELLSSVHPSE